MDSQPGVLIGLSYMGSYLVSKRNFRKYNNISKEWFDIFLQDTEFNSIISIIYLIDMIERL